MSKRQMAPSRVVLLLILLFVASCGAGEQGQEVSSTTVSSTSTSSPASTTAPTTNGDDPNHVDGATGTAVFSEGAEVLVAVTPDGSYKTSRSFADGTIALSAFDTPSLTLWVIAGDDAGKNVNHPPSGPDSKVVGADYWSSLLWDAALRLSRGGAGDEVTWTSIVPGDTAYDGPAEVSCEYTVRLDSQTRLLLAYTVECPDRPAATFEMTEFDPAARIDPATFLVPDDVDNVVTDQGFHHVTLDEARAAVGYALPVPQLPTGLVLEEVVWTPHAVESPMEISDMPSRDVVVMVFRDGYQRVTVTTRTFVASFDLGQGVTAPVVWNPWVVDGRSTVTIEGAIDGTPIEFTSLADISRAWAVTDEVVITVDGALSEAELNDLLASFRTSG